MSDIKLRFDVDGHKICHVYSGNVVERGGFNVSTTDKVVDRIINSSATRIVIVSNEVAHLRVLCGGNIIPEAADSLFPNASFIPAFTDGGFNENGLYFASSVLGEEINDGDYTADNIIENGIAMMTYNESSSGFQAATGAMESAVADNALWAQRQTLGRFVSVKIPNDHMESIVITGGIRNDTPANIRYVALEET